MKICRLPIPSAFLLSYFLSFKNSPHLSLISRNTISSYNTFCGLLPTCFPGVNTGLFACVQRCCSTYLDFPLPPLPSTHQLPLALFPTDGKMSCGDVGSVGALKLLGQSIRTRSETVVVIIEKLQNVLRILYSLGNFSPGVKSR
jgi:hypothetical protein